MNSVYRLFSNRGATIWPPLQRPRKICLTKLTDETEFRAGVTAALQIYQLTSDWQKAIEVAERLVKLGKDKQRIEIAHFTVS